MGVGLGTMLLGLGMGFGFLYPLFPFPSLFSFYISLVRRFLGCISVFISFGGLGWLFCIMMLFSFFSCTLGFGLVSWLLFF